MQKGKLFEHEVHCSFPYI